MRVFMTVCRCSGYGVGDPVWVRVFLVCVWMFWISCGCSGVVAGDLDKLRVFWSGRGGSRSGCVCSG